MPAPILKPANNAINRMENACQVHENCGGTRRITSPPVIKNVRAKNKKEPLMALIPPFFLDCVVAIGAPTVDGTNWIGTGFLVGRPLPEEGTSEKTYNTFLVTNKHVLHNQQSIILRFNSIQGTETRDYPINLFKDGSQTWVGHPSENIDVAVQFINPNVLSEDSTRFSYFRLDETCMDTTEMSRSGVSEGDQLYVLGFPMGIVTHTSNYVIARGGVLSRVRDVLSNHLLDQGALFTVSG